MTERSGMRLAVLLVSCGLLYGQALRAQQTRGRSAQDPSSDQLAESVEDDESNRVEMDPFQTRYILESIEIRGNEDTLGSLIISHLLFEPGDTLDEDKVQLSRIRLLALGYFRDVHMRMEKGSTRGRVKLVVEVEERNTIIIDNLFFGVSETNPWWLGAGVSHLNFLGRGLVLSGAAVGSEYQQAARLGLMWPSVFNSKLQGGFKLHFSHGSERALKDRIGLCNLEKGSCTSQCDGLSDSDQRLEYYRYGGTLSLGLKLDRSHRISFDYHIEHIDADVGNRSACQNYPFRGYIRPGQSTYSSLTFRFDRDTRDDFFLSTRGMHLVVSVELSTQIPIGSDYEFSKYMLSYEQAIPAFADHAFRWSVTLGLIQDVGEPGSPFFTRFFVGDYAFFLIDKAELPRNLGLNFSDVFDYGDVMASVSVEYDWPLWSTGKFFYRGYVYGALNFSFVTKAEFLKSEDEEWSGRTKRPVSMDLGLKVDTPVGLFTLSFGYIFDLFL